jgi:hypothetical protein
MIAAMSTQNPYIGCEYSENISGIVNGNIVPSVIET